MAAKDGVLIRRRLRIFAAATALVLLCAVCVGAVSGAGLWTDSADTTWAGSGTQADPYLITSAAELAGLAQKVNNRESYSGDYFQLTTDIDLAGKTWTPIGSDDYPFKGIFDGGKHIVDNISIYPKKKAANSCYGLFGCLESPGIIHDLFIGDCIIDSERTSQEDSYGALVGLLKGGKLERCSVLGVTNVYVGAQGNMKYYIGGMVGEVTDSKGADITSEQLSNYMGNCTVRAFTTDFNKESTVGLLTGKPKLDIGLGTAPDTPSSPDEPEIPPTPVLAYYNVSILTMNVSGTGYTSQGTTLWAGTVGDLASAIYTIDEGFVLDAKNSTLSGEIKADNSLHLKVYLQRNHTTITLMSDGKKYATVSGYFESEVNLIFENPTKSGYEFVRWNPAIPDTFPANDLTVTAEWKEIPIFFSIVIPENLTLSNETYKGNMTVLAETFSIPKTSRILITVSSVNNYYLIEQIDNSVKLHYDLTVDGRGPLSQNAEVAVFTMENKLRRANLTAQLTETPQYAGFYHDSLTFTVTFENE